MKQKSFSVLREETEKLTLTTLNDEIQVSSLCSTISRVSLNNFLNQKTKYHSQTLYVHNIHLFGEGCDCEHSVV